MPCWREAPGPFVNKSEHKCQHVVTVIVLFTLRNWWHENMLSHHRFPLAVPATNNGYIESRREYIPSISLQSDHHENVFLGLFHNPQVTGFIRSEAIRIHNRTRNRHEVTACCGCEGFSGDEGSELASSHNCSCFGVKIRV
jgi:hypothetical protein